MAVSLAASCRRHEFPAVQDFGTVSFAMFRGLELDLLYETIERRPVPHRAGPDTARLARGWMKAAKHRAFLDADGKTW